MFASASVVLALGLGWVLAPYLGVHPLFITLLGIILYARIYAGHETALLVTITGAAGGMVISAGSRAAGTDPQTTFIASAIAYALVGVVISFLPLVPKRADNERQDVALTKEVTRHQTTNAALRETRELFELLVRSVQDYAIFMLNPEGIIVSWNQGAERIKGYTADEIIGQSFSTFYTPEDRAAGLHKKAMETAIREGHFEGEAWRMRKDGTRFWANIVLTAVYDDSGTLVGFAKVTRDATDRRNAELALERTKVELEQRVIERAAAIKELESFGYSVSHDLRAPLRQLQGLSRALAEDYADRLDDEGLEFLESIEAASERMEVLVDELLKLSQLSMGKLEQQEINLSDAAREIADELLEQHPERNLNFTIHETQPVVGDPALLHVVLRNLLDNSVKFTGGRERAEIEFGVMRRDDQTVYYVRDNGVGFDMKYSQRLFGPFQRLHTQTEFHGTGVGLATVQRILRRHSGSIWVQSAPDQGATFYFTLGKIADDDANDSTD